MMRWFTTNYLEDQRGKTGKLVDRGFHLHDVPRFMPLCRLFGHKPVVDGTKSTRPENPGNRWVCCDRCGVRPEPQGALDPERWDVGDSYPGPWSAPLPSDRQQRWDTLKSLKGSHYPPGPWPAHPTGDLGGQLVIGRSFGGVGVELEVGGPGDDHTPSANIRLHHLGALYLHTGLHGRWLQRRFNNTDYDSRVIEFAFAHNGFRWRLWVKGDEWSRETPRWRDGSICLDPRELLWGPVKFYYDHIGEPEQAVVRMPHGDDHEVTLLLQRQYVGRPRGKRREQGWVVEWDCPTGIPYRTDDDWKGGSAYGSGVEVSHRSAEDGTWVMEATAAIAVAMTRTRTRYNYSSERAVETARAD
jgi:hypothetical protein